MWLIQCEVVSNFGIKSINIFNSRLYTIWSIWKLRNSAIFQEKTICVRTVIIKFVFFFNEKRQMKEKVERRQVRFRDIWRRYPVGFFDGTSRHLKCGCGAFLVMKPDTFYHLWWEGGEGTNTRGDRIMGFLKAAKWTELVNIFRYTTMQRGSLTGQESPTNSNHLF